MLEHDEVEQFLAATFPPQGPDVGLRLVARWANPDLGLPEGRARIFIPDIHLLSNAAARRFPNTGFRMKEEFTRFLKALTGFKNIHPGDLDVFQLGDFFDIWRTKGSNSKKKVDEVAADHGELLALLLYGPPLGARARVVAGNHDYDLHNLGEWNLPRFWFLNDSPAGVPDALALHGDSFDFIEDFFPDDLKALAVQLATQASAGQHELDHEDLVGVLALNDQIPRADVPVGVSQAEFSAGGSPTEPQFNVVRWTSTVGAVGKYFRAAAGMAMELRERRRDIRLVVCGHSHDARIVVGDRGDGVTLALMDCGAWIGQCRFGLDSSWRKSAQIGVLIQNDARIYQLA